MRRHTKLEAQPPFFTRVRKNCVSVQADADSGIAPFHQVAGSRQSGHRHHVSSSCELPENVRIKNRFMHTERSTSWNIRSSTLILNGIAVLVHSISTSHPFEYFLSSRGHSQHLPPSSVPVFGVSLRTARLTFPCHVRTTCSSDISGRMCG